MAPYLAERFAHPSALYKNAQEVRGEIEEARAKVAQLINADPEEIIFTSGGTEADNTGVKAAACVLRTKGGNDSMICIRWVSSHGVHERERRLSVCPSPFRR
jgi:cysteine desulfurase